MNEVTSNELPGTEKLEELIELALAEARRLGVDQVEVAASHDKGLSTTVRLGEVESLEYSNDRGVWVTVYRNSRKGSASTSDFRPEALREAVEKDCSFANYTAADECSGLAEAELMASADLPDLDLKHDWNLTPDKAIEMAIACEDAARSFDSRITKENRILDRALADDLCDVFARPGIKSDSNNPQPLPTEVILQSVESWEGRDTRRAPCGPEVQ